MPHFCANVCAFMGFLLFLAVAITLDRLDCPTHLGRECNGKGVCRSGKCVCEPDVYGEACHVVGGYVFMNNDASSGRGQMVFDAEELRPAEFAHRIPYIPQL